MNMIIFLRAAMSPPHTVKMRGVSCEPRRLNIEKNAESGRLILSAASFTSS
ncbi:MAG: hypothetical protein ACD_47C00205G0004 [uncultured bacterium]|nr:MAG: hypothetical protein ACD_47C00205G0004 [uncultured bacterium]